jgi:hypothetical protein
MQTRAIAFILNKYIVRAFYLRIVKATSRSVSSQSNIVGAIVGKVEHNS